MLERSSAYHAFNAPVGRSIRATLLSVAEAIVIAAGSREVFLQFGAIAALRRAAAPGEAIELSLIRRAFGSACAPCHFLLVRIEARILLGHVAARVLETGSHLPADWCQVARVTLLVGAHARRQARILFAHDDVDLGRRHAVGSQLALEAAKLLAPAFLVAVLGLWRILP
jgi:hypothetical protein